MIILESVGFGLLVGGIFAAAVFGLICLADYLQGN
jgi:hypothetical protein